MGLRVGGIFLEEEARKPGRKKSEEEARKSEIRQIQTSVGGSFPYLEVDAMRIMGILMTIVCFAGPVFGQAGPPLITDDTGTPGAGGFELNLAWTFDRTDGEESFESPLVDLSVGVTETVQFSLTIPYLVQDFSQRRDGAIGKATLGSKWRFLETEGFALSTSPAVAFPIENSAEELGFEDDRLDVFLPIETSFDALGGSFAAQIGYLHADDDAWFAGFAYAHSLGEQFEVAGEVALERELGGARTGLVNIGGRYQIAESLQILGSVGHGIDFLGDDGPDWIAYGGIQLAF